MCEIKKSIKNFRTRKMVCFMRLSRFHPTYSSPFERRKRTRSTHRRPASTSPHFYIMTNSIYCVTSINVPVKTYDLFPTSPTINAARLYSTHQTCTTPHTNRFLNASRLKQPHQTSNLQQQRLKHQALHPISAPARLQTTPSNTSNIPHKLTRQQFPPQITPSGLAFWQGRVKVCNALTLSNAPPHWQPLRVGLSKISND